MEHDNDKFWRLRQFWQSFKAIIEKVIKTICKSFVLLRLYLSSKLRQLQMLYIQRLSC